MNSINTKKTTIIAVLLLSQLVGAALQTEVNGTETININNTLASDTEIESIENIINSLSANGFKDSKGGNSIITNTNSIATNSNFLGKFDNVVPRGWSAADYDNDGDLDLFISGDSYNIGGASGYSTLLINNGDGTFIESSEGSTFTNLRWSTQAWGDYDGDGDLDLVLIGSTNGIIAVTELYDNNGDGTFTLNSSISSVLTDVALGSLAWGDYDNDGDLDLVISGIDNTFSPSTKLYVNEGDGSFSVSSSSSTLVGVYLSSLEWADYDNDGDLDLFIAGTEEVGDLGSRKVALTSLYINDGNGGFTNAVIPGNLADVHLHSGALSLSDYDSDGDLDLIISGEDDNGDASTKLFTNNGNGTFSNSAISSSFTDVTQSSLDWGDYDNDGDIDIVISGSTDRTVSGATVDIYENNGDGTFTKDITATSKVEHILFGSLIWGDFDNSGSLDLAITGALDKGTFLLSAGRVELLISDTSGTAPSVPTNLAVTTTDDEVRLSWTASTDTEGGPISYNVHVIRNGVAKLKVSSQSDTSNGYHRVTGLGNAGLTTSFTLDKNTLISGSYTFSVQAIDGAQNASGFTSLDPMPIIGRVFKKRTSSALSYVGSTFKFLSDFDVVDFYADSILTLRLETSFSDTIFVDQNDNQEFDESEPILDGTGFDINLLDSGVLTLKSRKSRYKKIKLKLEGSSTIDSLEIEIIRVEATPEIEGTPNENGWYLMSNPFTTTIGDMLDNVWTQGAVNSDAPSGTPTLYTFSQGNNQYEAVTTDLDTTKLSAGEGLLVYLFYFDDINDLSPANGGWPKTLNNYGDPFGENIDVEVKNVDHDGTPGTSGNEGFVLLGNPYGWSISVDSVIATLKRADPLANNFIYTWDTSSKQFVLKSSGTIAPYQSFFTRAVTSGVTASLSFDYNDFEEEVEEKRAALSNIIMAEFRLNARDRDYESSSYLSISEMDASEHIDPSDGYYLGSYASEYANLYTQIGDQELTINNIPTNLDQVIEFPIYLDATFSGDFEIEWDNSVFPTDWNMMLTEISSGKSINMKQQDSFDFSSTIHSKTKFGLRALSEESSLSKSTELGTSPIFILTITPKVSTNSESVFDVPSEVELDQNYPNPFNPTSIIQFGVPNTAKVQLEVFDMLGRKVATLVNNEIKSPGRYNVEFDARNLSSGMYIYRFVIGNKILTKKMTLIK